MEDKEKNKDISGWVGVILLVITLLTAELYTAGRLWSMGELAYHAIDESIFYEDFYYYLILGFKRSLLFWISIPSLAVYVIIIHLISTFLDRIIDKFRKSPRDFRLTGNNLENIQSSFSSEERSRKLTIFKPRNIIIIAVVSVGLLASFFHIELAFHSGEKFSENKLKEFQNKIKDKQGACPNWHVDIYKGDKNLISGMLISMSKDTVAIFDNKKNYPIVLPYEKSFSFHMCSKSMKMSP